MKIIYNKIEYDCNDVFSGKDFTGRANQHFDGISGIIYASCFSQDNPDSHCFPDTMVGITFIKCNLDNVFIPIGNTVIDCSQKRYKVQNDRNDWLIDENNNPVKPMNHKLFTKLGLPIPLPKDIPMSMVEESIDLIEYAKILKVSLEII